MNIVMMSNTYKPIVGGLERSVETLAGELRQRGHRVIIVVPMITKGGAPEPGVFRVPAVTDYRRTGFPLQLPLPTGLAALLDGFRPQIVHSHHPFLIGDTAMRVASKLALPLVFTMHTLYERYTHYLPLDSPTLKRFLVHLSTGYANLCDHVFAPSKSVAELLRGRGVTAPVSVLPTGIRVAEFTAGKGAGTRQRFAIPQDAFVVGLVSRIAREKNLDFLLPAVAGFMERRTDAHFLVIGSGPMRSVVEAYFTRRGLHPRLHMPGALRGQGLSGAYHAMDVFAFSSLSETQGLVLAESMASGVPVVAVDASGIRDTVKDRVNGRLVTPGETGEFVRALSWIASLQAGEKARMREACARTAEVFSVRRSVDSALEVYSRLVKRGSRPAAGRLARASRLVKAEWMLMLNMLRSAGKAVVDDAGEHLEV